MAGIYIHIPFCSQYCTYCNFYSVKQLGLRERFVEAFVKEAWHKKDFFKEKGSSVTTLYIGGGTPSVLLPAQLEVIVHGVTEAFGLVLPNENQPQKSVGENYIEEFTIEVNPNDITPDYAAFLVKIGVNRVSMGMQSFVDSHLKWMNRRHSSQEGIQAYRILREAGIKNISLDLIFGYSSLSDKEWEYNIDTMVSLAPEHISAYQMSIEPGSALGAMARKGLYKPLFDEECEKQYLLLQKKLSEAGYVQYEISNFAKPDKTSKDSAGRLESLQEQCWRSAHNSSYWDGTPYLGLGPAAHSFTGKDAPGGARRLWNNPSVKKYCSYYCGDNHPEDSAAAVSFAAEFAEGIAGYEELTVEDIFNETIMLGLRRTCGFPLDSLASLDASLLHQIVPDINRLVMSGQLIMEDHRGSQHLGSSQSLGSSPALGASSACVDSQLPRESQFPRESLPLGESGAPARTEVSAEAISGKKIRIPASKLFISDSIIRELFV